MRAVAASCVSLLVIAVSSACFRYVEEMRPMTPADCAPEPPSRAFVRIVRDSSSIGTISGQVFDADAEGGMPRPTWEAVVIVLGTNRGAKTDSLGKFRIDSLTSGRYAIRIRRIGFEPRLDSAVLTDSFGQNFELGLVRAPVDGCPGFMSIVTRKKKLTWP
jgi:hypothetical protein